MSDTAQPQITNLNENVMNLLRQLHLVIGHRLTLLDQTQNAEQTVLYRELQNHLEIIDEVLRMGGRAVNDEDQKWLQEIIETFIPLE